MKLGAVSQNFIIFATMNNIQTPETWAENVILADGDYIDRVAFDLIVNFERMLERRIPQADLARWIDCVALDGGLQPAEGQETNSIQVVLLHNKQKAKLENFTPAHYTDELDGKAFSDQLGEFCISCVPVEELTTMADLFCESLQYIMLQPAVKRIMVVGDEQYYNQVRSALNSQHAATTTVFTMQPQQGGRFQQEILGYSLMAALGIKGEELSNK